MKFVNKLGLIFLAIYLIVDSLLGFGLNLGPAIFLVYLIGLVGGICLLIGQMAGTPG
jgi:hypothetical protein